VSEKRRSYRQFTPEQKIAIVMAGLRGCRSARYGHAHEEEVPHV
jgi:hypothetical protein